MIGRIGTKCNCSFIAKYRDSQTKEHTMRNHKKMASRVALKYMKKEGFLGAILDLFKEPERELKKTPKFDIASLWFHGNPMYGLGYAEVQRRLGMGSKNTAVVEHNGDKIKVSVRMKTYQQGKHQNVMDDLFAVVTATGVDKNIPKRDIQKFLVLQAKDAGLKDRRRDITKEPKGKEY